MNTRSVEGRGDILHKRIAQLEEQIAGLQDGITAQRRQKALIAQEIQGVSSLVDRGLERRPRLLALQRDDAELDRTLAAARSSIARLRQQIGETLLQIDSLQIEMVNEATERLREVEQVILDTQERLQASEDVMRRTVIRAPVDGQVLALRFSTVGGVVGPGEAILDLVPADEQVLINARIRPTDIDDVFPGLTAKVRLTAFSIRSTPLLEGIVDTVAGDVLRDPSTETTYYNARIRLPASELEKLKNLKLLPGMPADVMITTKTRSALAYFVEPLLSHIEKSFREK
ncbi:MAG: HlyD family type I secretion periplasmic adaptor subunit [Gammaproteobacteria bacterium]|uniref:HlyD family type I secretion periplasmic adaptor subunit n=1 Tax=Thalassobaculum sp. TaxID=2022740 RepID=UPI0032ED211B